MEANDENGPGMTDEGARVIITDVEAIVLDTGKNYPNPAEAGEAHGVRFVSLLKITTDTGIVGWADIETQPHVGKAIVEAPSGGAVGFESLRAALSQALVQSWQALERLRSKLTTNALRLAIQARLWNSPAAQPKRQKRCRAKVNSMKNRPVPTPMKSA